MKDFVSQYITAQKSVLDSIPTEAVAELITIFKKAWREDRQIFAFGNGGSAANASHFVTDLGKGASDALSKRFRCMSINDNVSWITALGNDYSYEEIFTRQLTNYAQPGDILLTMSVSGNSPNLIHAVNWAKENNIYSVALVGSKRGKLAEIADFVIPIESTHYGRVEDAHMGICHMLCYAFMENADAIS